MSKEIWIVNIAEGSEMSREFKSLVAKGQKLAKDAGYKLCCVILGSAARERSGSCMVWADKIYCVHTAEAESQGSAAYTKTLEMMAGKYQPEIMLFTTERISNVISASLGIRLDTGVVAHSGDFRIEKGLLISSIPTYGGQAIGDIFCKGKLPQIASAKVQTAQPEEHDFPAEYVLEKCVLDEKCTVKLVSLERREDERVRIEDADVIVCAGFGIKNRENWKKIKLLAKRLGGEAACTRSGIKIADVAEEDYLIGVSGKTVAPRAYIGFGVSGSTQHICGMSESKIVININTNDGNSFFETSDYGYVGDAEDILNQLINQTN